MSVAQLIKEYAAGPQKLRQAVAGMTREQAVAKPVPGKWSTLEVICHIADFEPVYADRMKRVLAENEPALIPGDPDLFAAKLAYAARDLEEELTLIEVTRKQMVRILSQLAPADFTRVGIHAIDGPLSLEELLRRITGHIPHHAQFIAEKRAAMKV